MQGQCRQHGALVACGSSCERAGPDDQGESVPGPSLAAPLLQGTIQHLRQADLGVSGSCWRCLHLLQTCCPPPQMGGGGPAWGGRSRGQRMLLHLGER